MSKQSEATLLVRIKAEGEKTLTAITFGFNQIVEAAKHVKDAIVGVGSKVIELGVAAEKVEQVRKSFDNLAASQGKNSDQILSQMKAMTEGMVSSMDLMVAANKAILLGLPVDKFPEMLKIAKSASEATGESMQFMLDSIVTALGRQSKLILDNLGIMIDVEASYDKYATTLGKTAAQLTEAEKKQAFINEAMRIGVENANKQGAATDNGAKAWERLKVKWEEASVVLGSNLRPAMTAILGLLDKVIDKTKESTTGDGFLSSVSHTFSKVTTMAGAIFKDGLTDGYKKGIAEVDKLNLDFQRKLVEAKVKAGESMTGSETLLYREMYEEQERLAAEKNTKIAEGDKQRLEAEKKEAAKVAAEKAKKEVEEATKVRVKRTADETADLIKRAKSERIQKAETIAQIEEAEKELDKELEKLHQQKIERIRVEEKNVLKRKELEKEAAHDVEELRRDIDFASKERRLKITEDIAKAEEKASDERAEEEQIRMDRLGSYANDFITGGFKQVGQSAVSELTDSFLPGFGAAAGSMFSLLTMESEEFVDTFSELFSGRFIANIGQNLTTGIGKALNQAINGKGGGSESITKLLDEMNAKIIDGEKELQKMLEQIQKEADAKARRDPLEARVQEAADKRAMIERELNKLLEEEKKRHEEKMRGLLEERLAGEVEALRSAKKERERLERDLEELREKKDEAAEEEVQVKLDEALFKERAIVDFAEEKREALKSQIATLHGELFFANDSESRAAREADIAALQKQLDQANADVIAAEDAFNKAAVAKRAELGIPLLKTIDEQIAETEARLAAARQAELDAEAAHNKKKIALETELGLRLKEVTAQQISDIQAMYFAAREEERKAREALAALPGQIKQEAVEAKGAEIQQNKEAAAAEWDRRAAELRAKRHPMNGRWVPTYNEKQIIDILGARPLNRGGSVGDVIPIQRFAQGGTVDTVPAMLTPGEFVVNAGAARKNRAQLEAINNGGGGGGGGTSVTLNVYGGLLGDRQDAARLLEAIDKGLWERKRTNKSHYDNTGI